MESCTTRGSEIGQTASFSTDMTSVTCKSEPLCKRKLIFHKKRLNKVDFTYVSNINAKYLVQVFVDNVRHTSFNRFQTMLRIA